MNPQGAFGQRYVLGDVPVGTNLQWYRAGRAEAQAGMNWGLTAGIVGGTLASLAVKRKGLPGRIALAAVLLLPPIGAWLGTRYYRVPDSGRSATAGSYA